LRRLKMRETKARQVTMLRSECRQLVNHLYQAAANQNQTFLNLNQFRIVRYETTRRAKMDNRPRIRALISPRMNMSHDVVPQFALVTVRGIEIDVVDIRSHLGDLRVTDIQSEFLLTFGQRNPKPPPCGMLFLSRPDRGHFSRGISRDERVFVDVVGHNVSFRVLRWRAVGVSPPVQCRPGDHTPDCPAVKESTKTHHDFHRRSLREKRQSGMSHNRDLGEQEDSTALNRGGSRINCDLELANSEPAASH
jgi:hypothetical protein